MAGSEKAPPEVPPRPLLPAQHASAIRLSPHAEDLEPPPSADHEWIQAAMHRFETPLLRYAARLINDAERARDVVQETFAALLGESRSDRTRWRDSSPAADESDRDRPTLQAWLYTVCRNRALDVRRKERRMTTMTHADLDGRHAADLGPHEQAETADATAGALAQLARLPANQQEVVRLKFQHGLSYREIAGVTGLTVSHVGVLLHEAIKALRDKFTAKDEISAAGRARPAK